MLEHRGWSSLPEHILVSIFSHLSRADQARAAQTCSSWAAAFNSPYLWTHFNFWFYTPKQSKYLESIALYGKYFRKVYIELDQAVELNRTNACAVISKMFSLPERRLRKLKIKFTGENPYFYAGLEFVTALTKLFGPPCEKCNVINNLIDIDLSGLAVSLDDAMVNTLSANNPHLEYFNIQNKSLVCKVSPTCVLRLVQKCRKLKDLRLFNCSLSEDILIAFTEPDRVPIEHLSIICRREEKYMEEISSETWKGVVSKLTGLRVSIAFDHTCPLHKVSGVMKPEIPVKELRLETFTYIYDELRLASMYYADFLEKLVIQTPMPRNSPEFNQALIELATVCKHLKSLHVFCVLEKDTVERILNLHPEMKENKFYTLEHNQKPHPWTAGKNCW